MAGRNRLKSRRVSAAHAPEHPCREECPPRERRFSCFRKRLQFHVCLCRSCGGHWCKRQWPDPLEAPRRTQLRRLGSLSRHVRLRLRV